MPKHGGKRKGAGKPAQYSEPMKRINVTLDKETVEFYARIGEGNVSQGIREYWRENEAMKGRAVVKVNRKGE